MRGATCIRRIVGKLRMKRSRKDRRRNGGIVVRTEDSEEGEE